MRPFHRSAAMSEAIAMTDRACPLAFVAAAAFASSLVWLYSMLLHLPMR
jgi:hypothetical protein